MEDKDALSGFETSALALVIPVDFPQHSPHSPRVEVQGVLDWLPRADLLLGYELTSISHHVAPLANARSLWNLYLVGAGIHWRLDEEADLALWADEAAEDAAAFAHIDHENWPAEDF